MNISVFCKSPREAIMIGGNLGRIEVVAAIPGTYDPNDLEKMNKLIAQAKSIGYIKVINEENTYIFTWLDEAEIAIDTVGDGKVWFDYDKMKFLITNPRQAETAKNILENPNNTVIYNCAPLPLFARFYDYIGIKKKFHLVNISEMSTESITEAFKHPQEYTESLKTFLTEITAQKFYWMAEYNVCKALQASLPDAMDTSFWATILLRLLVKRHDEITNFQGSSSFAVLGEFETASGECFTAKSKGIEFNSREEALKYISTLPETASVTDYKIDTASLPPKGLLNYEEAVIMCHKEFGYTQDVTNTALQELYSRGYITSPNTNKTTFPLKAQRKTLEILKTYKKSRTFSAQLETFSDDDFNIPLHMMEDTTEHGILPTEQIIRQPRSEEMLKVYTVIVREALKCVLPNLNVKRNKILLTAESTLFSASGSTLIAKGYTVLDEDKAYINDIPENIDTGDLLKASYSVRLMQKSAKPQYTEKEIIKMISDCTNDMVNLQNVTTALQELQDKNLVIKKKKTLLPSSTAIRFIHGILPVEEIFSLQTLSLWCDNLRRIRTANSINDAEIVSKNALETIKNTVYEVCSQMKYVMGETTDIPCPTCINSIRKTKERYFCTTCGFSVATVHRGKYLRPNNLKYLIKFRTSPILDGFEQGRGRFYMDENNQIHVTEHLEQLCPVCRKQPLIINNNTDRLECKNSTCNFSLSFTLLGHTFSQSEITSLLTEYKTGVIRNIVFRGETLHGFFFIDKDTTIKFKKL